ncbi:MAG: ABC transporter substrate-binding protein, partial [Gammaproteobacteria bacterium]|nr:ABC transporter substrate-binding protein [Gammaproteobacteria bacterium]
MAGDNPNSIKLGLMPPLTGLVGIYGSEISRAGRIACDEVNEAGGVLGRPLELIIEDDGSLPEPAVEAATRLVDDHHCVAIIGNLLSNSRISVAYRVAEPRRVPYLNFSFYEGSILSRYFFHFAALPNQQIDRMIPCMREKFGPRMFFAGNNYEWPRGSIDAAKRALKLAGGEAVGEIYTAIGVSRSVIDSLLDKVEAAAPDVFVPYFAGADQITLLTRFTERGLKSRMAVVMGHYDELMASKLPPEVREGFYSSNTYFMTVDTDANREYLRRLAALEGVSGIWPRGNGILTNFGEGAYLCVKAFAQAANTAGSLDAEALVDALNTIRVNGPQGTVQMDPITQHATVNTYLSRCNADGVFEIIEHFGTLPPVMPDRYSHQRVENRATLEEDIRLQARMLEQMSEAVLLVDARERKIVYANGGADRMFGYAKGELLGLPVAQLNSPEAGDPEAATAAIFEALSHAGSWQGNIRNVRRDGGTLWCFVSVSAFTHPVYGEVWMAVHQDISARVRSEEKLKRSEERLRQVLDAVNDGVWDWNPSTHENYYSPRWKAIFGYLDEELPNLDSTFFDMVHPEDRGRVATAVARHFEHNEPFRVEIRMRHKDGNYRWTLNRGEAIRDGSGKPVRMVGTITDVTEIKLEEDLRTRLSAIIEASPDFIGFADAKTAQILYVNMAGRAMCGIAAYEDVTQLRIGNVHPDWVNRMFEEEILPTAIRDGVWRGECAFVSRDGHEIPVSMVLLCHRGADGAPEFFSTVSRDITDRKRTDEELHRHRDHLEELVRERTNESEAARDDAVRANKAKSEFLARMSHELRTPMNAILGFAQVLEMEKLNDEQLGFAREIESAGTHLLELIN